jgi:hypothetical protein
MIGRRFARQRDARQPTTLIENGRIYRHEAIDLVSIKNCIIGHLAVPLEKRPYTNHG